MNQGVGRAEKPTNQGALMQPRDEQKQEATVTPGADTGRRRCYQSLGMRSSSSSLSFFFFFVFLGPHLWHMEVPRRGVEWQLLLPVYATAIATPDLSHACDLHHSHSNAGSKPRL